MHSSSRRGPFRPFSTTLARAAVKSSPASTLSVSRSTAYGSARTTARCRFPMRSRSQIRGYPPPPTSPTNQAHNPRPRQADRRQAHAARCLEDHDGAHQQVSVSGLEHRRDQVRPVPVEEQSDEEGQRSDDQALELALAGEGGDLPLQPEALANGRADRIEHLREVAAELAGDAG